MRSGKSLDNGDDSGGDEGNVDDDALVDVTFH